MKLKIFCDDYVAHKQRIYKRSFPTDIRQEADKMAKEYVDKIPGVRLIGTNLIKN